MAGLVSRLGASLSAVVLLAIAATIPSGAASASSSDTVPPVVDSLTGPVAVRADADDHAVLLSYAWSAHDAESSDPVTYDLRYGWRYEVASGDSAWHVGLQDSLATTWTATLQWYDPDYCVQVRARDAAGNTSAWTGPRCTVLDNAPPYAYAFIDAQHFHGFGVPLHDGLASTPVSYSYAAQDDDQVDSYDVDVRLAAPGASYGPWTSPPAWQGTTATSVAIPATAGSQVCFRVRARDRAGHVGDYAPTWCKAVPYDDRDFRLHGVATQVRLAGVLGPTATRAGLREGSMTRRHVRGQDIWVRVVGRHGDTCVGVTLGGRGPSGGCWLVSVPGAVWQNFHFRAGSHGRLRIRTSSLVDAVAVRPTIS